MQQHCDLVRKTTVKVLLSEDELRDGVKRMADEINAQLENKTLTVIAVMTGSLVLVADLIRYLSMPVQLGALLASSYRGETTRGDLEIDHAMLPDLTDERVLVVDDIFDTGHTLDNVMQRLKQLGPSEIHSAVLLQKSDCQQVQMKPDFIGFEIPDEFVVGYGLDYKNLFRNLPYVAAMESHDLTAFE